MVTYENKILESLKGETPKEKFDYLNSLIRKAEELEQLFEVQHQADLRALKMWQEKTGKELTIPDRADMVVFLLDQIDNLIKSPHFTRTLADIIGEMTAIHHIVKDICFLPEGEYVIMLKDESNEYNIYFGDPKGKIRIFDNKGVLANYAMLKFRGKDCRIEPRPEE